MKTHVIQLEQNDDFVSISDKLTWGKAKRVLLVYPSIGELNLRKIDLILVQRAAKKMGYLIGLVSIPSKLKELAKELEIPFFNSINEAQRKGWRKRNGKKEYSELRPNRDFRKQRLEIRPTESKWRSWIGFRLGFFSLAVFSILLLTLIFIPSAAIHLNILSKTQSILMRLIATDKIDEVNYSDLIPSNFINVEVEGHQQSQVFTIAKIPDKFASGFARFKNITEEMVFIPTGTIVTRLNDSNLRFETTKSGEVSAGIGNTIDLPIRALTEGETGNLEANSIGSLIGDLGIKLTVTNTDPTSGGTNRALVMASEIDRKNLFNNLESVLRIQAIQKARLLLGDKDVLFNETIKIEKINQDDFIPAIDQPGEQLSLNLIIVYSIHYAKYSDIIKLATPAMKLNLPENYELVNNSLMVETLGNPLTNPSGITILNLKITQKIRRIVDPLILARLIQGLTVNEANDLLYKKYGNEVSPSIKIRPSWWSRLPIVPLRIDIYF